jgi:hypothetical protein
MKLNNLNNRNHVSSQVYHHVFSHVWYYVFSKLDPQYVHKVYFQVNDQFKDQLRLKIKDQVNETK